MENKKDKLLDPFTPVNNEELLKRIENLERKINENQIDFEKLREYNKEKQEEIDKNKWFKKTQIERTQQFGIINGYLQVLIEKNPDVWLRKDEYFDNIAKWVLSKWVEFEHKYLNEYFAEKKK